MRIDVNEQIVIIISDREEKRNQLAQKFYNEAYVWLFAKIFFRVWVSEWVKQTIKWLQISRLTPIDSVN